MTSNTHIMQNYQIWLDPFFFGTASVWRIISNGLAAMAIQAVFINRLSTRFQLMVAIDTGNFIFHGMLRMTEYYLIFGVHLTGRKRIFKDVRNLGFGIAEPADLKQENR